MIKKDISPEEKLLNLIKNKKPHSVAAQEQIFKKKSDAMPDKAPGGELSKEPDVQLGKATVEAVVSKAGEHISGMLKSEIFRSKVFEPARLKIVNKYLLIVLGVLAFYFIIDIAFIRPYKNIQSIVAKSGSEQDGKNPGVNNKNPISVKDYSSYSDSVSGRSVFGKAQGSGASSGEDVSTSENLPERMGLVGIIAGDNPQAIIEDKKSQKTYYLNKGQSFDGYVVEEITSDKVVLDFEGRKISLFL